MERRVANSLGSDSAGATGSADEMPEDTDQADMALYRASLESEVPTETANAGTNYDDADYGDTPKSSAASSESGALAADDQNDSDI